MPILPNRIAHTTGFQANCGLNCLAHVLVRNIERLREGSLDVLCEAFNQYYSGTNLTVDEFRQAMRQIHNPVHLEIVLGPVLRTMLVNPNVITDRDICERNRKNKLNQPNKWLEHRDILSIANFFGIRVESYTSLRVRALGVLASRENFNPTTEEIERTEQELNASGIREFETNDFGEDGGGSTSFPVLKLWNRDGTHFEYEEEDEEIASAHNGAYNKGCAYKASEIRKRIQERIREMSKSPDSSAPRNIDFSSILTEYEEEQGIRRSGNFSHMGSFGGLFDGMFDRFVGDEDSDSGFTPSSSGFIGIFESIMHFSLKIAEMLKGVISAMGGAFDSMQQQPASGETTADFSDLGERFAEATAAWSGFGSHTPSRSKVEDDEHSLLGDPASTATAPSVTEEPIPPKATPKFEELEDCDADAPGAEEDPTRRGKYFRVKK